MGVLAIEINPNECMAVKGACVHRSVFFRVYPKGYEVTVKYDEGEQLELIY